MAEQPASQQKILVRRECYNERVNLVEGEGAH